MMYLVTIGLHWVPNVLQQFKGVNPAVVFSMCKMFIFDEIIGHILACTIKRDEIFFYQNLSRIQHS